MKQIKKKNQMKQCDLIFKDDSQSTLWIEIDDAIEQKEIKIENRILNINGMAKITKVYHGKIIES